MKYKKLSFEEFSRAMILTQDLDPVYTMLHSVNWPSRAQLERFCLAYWCFYHSGVAAWIAQHSQKDFWPMMQQAHDEKWPRGTERRHFRGDSSKNAIAYMRDYGTPNKVVKAMTTGNVYEDVARHTKEFPFFGPWIAFKVADMKERVLGEPCYFPVESLDIFKDPRIGAHLVMNGGDITDLKQASLADTHEVVRTWMVRLGDLSAPPGEDRPINAQEVETCLCKWKSHLKGGYDIGKDTIEIAHQLDEADCALANKLKKGLPHERLNSWRGSVR